MTVPLASELWHQLHLRGLYGYTHWKNEHVPCLTVIYKVNKKGRRKFSDLKIYVGDG